MGANIGTTVTAWLVAWLGFEALVHNILLKKAPIILVPFLFFYLTKGLFDINLNDFSFLSTT
jgi:Na+/phosphate symporter